MSDRQNRILGHYKLLQRLGQGGFAEVYLGEHIHLKTYAAIKILHTQLAEDGLEAFRTEARMLANLKHPNIVQVLDFGVDEMTPYLVMQYAPNGTLRQRHPRGTSVALNLIVSYVQQIASALQYAHNQKVIHRDLKPENIVIGDQNQLLLSDFGIATLSASARVAAPDLAVSWSSAGTAVYMAPEQAQGRPVAASDQYALGVVVYEWLTGQPPFQGPFIELLAQQMTAPPPSLREKVPTLSAELEQVVFTALQKDPQQRFRQIQAFAQALKLAAQGVDEGLTRDGYSAILLEGSSPQQPIAVTPVFSSPQQPVATTPVFRAEQTWPTQPAGYSPSGYSPPVVAPPGNASHKRSPLRLIVPIAVALILILASTVGLFAYRNQVAQQQSSATATAQTQQHLLTQQQLLRQQATATAVGQQQATATAVGQQQVTATALATSQYPPFTKLAFLSPLTTASPEWASGAGCHFSSTGLQVSVATAGFSYFCFRKGIFSEMAYQATMSITQGDCGGIVFRATNPQNLMIFEICQDGVYNIITDLAGVPQFFYPQDRVNSAIHQGFSQQNVLAVTIQGDTLTLYINEQPVDTQRIGALASTLSQGQVGLFALAVHGLTAVSFINATVWTT